MKIVKPKPDSRLNGYSVKVIPMSKQLKEINLFRLLSDCSPLKKENLKYDKKNKVYVSTNLSEENIDKFLKRMGEELQKLDS